MGPVEAVEIGVAAEPHWLDEREQRAWRAYLAGASRLADRLDRELRAAHQLSLAEYEVLVRLSEAPARRIRMAELAAAANHSRSRLSHTVARLEDAGLVRRTECPGDRRGVLATLTDAGFARLAEASHTHVRGVREYFLDKLDPADLAVVGRAFAGVAADLDPCPSEDCAPPDPS